MKEIIIELDDMYSEVLSITAIGKHGNITNISTKAVELSKGSVLKFDGEKWTQKKSKHTGFVLEDEKKEVASDLISRSAVIQAMKECYLDEQLFEKDVFDKIKAIPAAYDVDAVEEELRKEKNTIPIATITIDNQVLQKMVDEKVKAIEIDIQAIKNETLNNLVEELEKVPTEYSHEEYNKAIRDVIKFVERTKRQVKNNE